MISCCPSFESLFQVAFAISPFPFYLPQYFSMTQQLSSSDSSDDCSPSDSWMVVAKEPLGAAIDRGGDHHLRKRNPLDIASSTGAGIASPPTSMGIDCMLYGTPSKSFEDETKHLDTGLSRATVLLLLSAHLLRLLHFHGVILQLQSEKQLEGAASEPVNLAKPTAASAAYLQGGSSILQWDLLGQSMSMIAMQLLLLHTMMLVRRKQINRQMKRMCDGEIAGNNSTDSSSSHSSPMADSVMMSGSITATSLETSNHGCNHRNTSPMVSTSQNMPYWRGKRQQCFRLTADHLHQLFSPHNILQSHSFLEYCELLMLVSISVIFVFDYHWFPRYGIKVVDGLKHISIVLESCLALPQAIRNHRKGTTEGLSMVMVGGWVAGDFFKLCYFFSNMISGGDRSNIVFIWGCIFSLALDSAVGVQVVRTNPELLEWQKRMIRSFWHWKSNKDEDAGQRSHGYFVTLLTSIFRWTRGYKPQSNSS